MQWASYLFKLYALSQFIFLTQLHGSLSFHMYKNRFKVTHHIVRYIYWSQINIRFQINQLCNIEIYNKNIFFGDINS